MNKQMVTLVETAGPLVSERLRLKFEYCILLLTRSLTLNPRRIRVVLQSMSECCVASRGGGRSQRSPRVEVVAEAHGGSRGGRPRSSRGLISKVGRVAVVTEVRAGGRPRSSRGSMAEVGQRSAAAGDGGLSRSSGGCRLRSSKQATTWTEPAAADEQATTRTSGRRTDEQATTQSGGGTGDDADVRARTRTCGQRRRWSSKLS